MKDKRPAIKRGRKEGSTNKITIDGFKLASIRVEKGYSQGTLSETIRDEFDVKITKIYISEIERYNLVSPKYLKMICEVLEISEESLK